MSSSYNVTTTESNNNQFQQGPTFTLTQDEIIFIENILVKVRDMLPNEMGENQQILEEIVLAEQIIGARLDPEAAEIGDSG